ncbi:MAG TPA: hypothetical protein VN708_12340 [Terriglobales bacterium]|jgi:hypothetical protein|nr:hypothetical protein [Terriglobales bacterium]
MLLAEDARKRRHQDENNGTCEDPDGPEDRHSAYDRECDEHFVDSRAFTYDGGANDAFGNEGDNQAPQK